MIFIEQYPGRPPLRRQPGGKKTDHTPEKTKYEGKKDERMDRPSFGGTAEKPPLQEDVPEKRVEDREDPAGENGFPRFPEDRADFAGRPVPTFPPDRSGEDKRKRKDHAEKKHRQREKRDRIPERKRGGVTRHAKNALRRKQEGGRTDEVSLEVAAPAPLLACLHRHVMNTGDLARLRGPFPDNPIVSGIEDRTDTRKMTGAAGYP